MTLTEAERDSYDGPRPQRGGVIRDPQPVGATKPPTRRRLHVDAVQAAGKLPIDFHGLGFANLSLAAHQVLADRGGRGPVGLGDTSPRSAAAERASGSRRRPGTGPVDSCRRHGPGSRTLDGGTGEASHTPATAPRPVRVGPSRDLRAHRDPRRADDARLDNTSTSPFPAATARRCWCRSIWPESALAGDCLFQRGNRACLILVAMGCPSEVPSVVGPVQFRAPDRTCLSGRSNRGSESVLQVVKLEPRTVAISLPAGWSTHNPVLRMVIGGSAPPPPPPPRRQTDTRA